MATLSQKRGLVRSSVTRLMNKIKAVVSDEAGILEDRIEDLDLHIGELHSAFKTLKERDAEYLDSLAAEEARYENEAKAIDEHNEPVKDLLHSANRTLKRLMRQLAGESAGSAASTETGPPSASALSVETQPPPAPSMSLEGRPLPPLTLDQREGSYNTSLPKFELPEFNGDILKWHVFWDVYEAEVHNRPHMADATKFHYLKSKLKGSAQSILDGLTPTNANYGKAITLLKERYGRNSEIIAAHYEGLRNIPKPGTDKASLERYMDKLEIHVRSLESLGRFAESSYGEFLVYMLISQVKWEVQERLARHHGQDMWTLNSFREAMYHEISILKTRPTQPSSQTQVSRFNPKVTHVMTVGVKADNRVKKCAFCAGDHFPSQCTEYSTVSERIKFVKEKKLCYNCLTNATHSMVKDCRSTKKCYHCGKAHHSSLHIDEDHSKSSNSSTQSITVALVTAVSPVPDSTVISVSQLSSCGNEGSPFVFLKTAQAHIQAKCLRALANLLLDDGSQRTFITTWLVRLMKLIIIRQEMLTLSGFLSCKPGPQLYDIVQFSVVDINHNLIQVEAVVLEQIIPDLADPFRDQVAALPYLKDLTLAHRSTDGDSFEVEILIGSDYYWSIVGDKTVRGPGPTAVFSRLGYLISGPLSGTSGSQHSSSIQLNVAVVEQPDVSQLWSLELLGIHPEVKSDHFEQYQDNDIEYRNGNYEARFPWKIDRPELLPNRVIAEKRTRSTVRKLGRSPDQLKLYDSIIQDQLQRGYIEKVPRHELSSPNCHVVPHFGVVKESMTTPLRIVYDFSCKDRNGVSLNDCLETGPPLHNNLFSILLRFRVHRFGIAADIERAFHQISLHPRDRDFTRFPWIINRDDPESEFEMYRFKVIPFGARSSPFILLCTIRKHLKQASSSFSTEMDQAVYVDNIFSGSDSEEELRELYEKARSLFKKAGLELKTWSSSSIRLEKQAALDQVLDPASVSKALGLLWNRGEDTLGLAPFKLTVPSDNQTTKRQVLSGISAVYDPFGFITPLTIGIRILMQDIWREKLGWDEPLPVHFCQKWKVFASQIEQVKVSCPRSYFGDKAAIQELHVFVDASDRAYGAVVYLVHQGKSAFVASKARVTPLKSESGLTLPQKELMAAYIGSLFASNIIDSLKTLKIKLRVNLWSDSQIVLCWLSSSDRHKSQFVANRVEKIKFFNSSNFAEWRYCPTVDNPADLLTRGINHQQFVTSRWFDGPLWLLNQSDWPVWSKLVSTNITTAIAVSSAVQTSPPDSESDLEKIIDVESYHWVSLIRVTANLFRAVANFKARIGLGIRVTGPITIRELRQAELKWVIIFQAQYFQVELTYLRNQKGSRPSLVSQLDLFIDEDGLLRCGGRLQHTTLNMYTKHPILLPKSSILTSMVIQRYHELMLHGSIGDTVCTIRQKYWIPTIRQRVRSILRKCTRCLKVQGKPYTPPNHAPLPISRARESLPFATTGIDYTGAFLVKSSNKGKECKVYICLFTCGTTRAVHLEVVDSLSTESFLQAFRRFASHHSLPELIISDNATTFESAARVLKKIYSDTKTQQFFSNRGIHWQFIPKRAPWYGGFWERLIGLTKTALRKMMGRTRLVLVEFQTLVCEIEAVLNDRPLTKVTSDFSDEPLTPAHLLYGRRVTTLPFTNTNIDEIISDPSYGSDSAVMSKSFMRLQKIKEAFWKVWSRSYLTSLREVHQSTKGATKQQIKVGELVLVHDEGPRLSWKMALVVKLIPSQDGLIRAAEIKTDRGITSRPIGKLYPLEVHTEVVSDTTAAEETQSNENSDGVTAGPVSYRPTRKAALEARRRFAAQFEDQDQ